MRQGFSPSQAGARSRSTAMNPVHLWVKAITTEKGGSKLVGDQLPQANPLGAILKPPLDAAGTVLPPHDQHQRMLLLIILHGSHQMSPQEALPDPLSQNSLPSSRSPGPGPSSSPSRCLPSPPTLPTGPRSQFLLAEMHTFRIWAWKSGEADNFNIFK